MKNSQWLVTQNYTHTRALQDMQLRNSKSIHIDFFPVYFQVQLRLMSNISKGQR